ncbi:MAG TPA: phosphoribosylformylglycinamidine cyclo-ligase [Acidimicrobiia bacterium]|nr:phosphoribosylformylglycinamidine cyclo-ligase [Acidimicrobiia bacterium]
MNTYRQAGVDLEGADRHVASIASVVTATWSDRVVGVFGGFAAGLTLPAGYVDPVLMLTTDGVGTKLELARRFDRWSGVGFDLVAMVVDDLAAAGASPLGVVDYMAVGALDPQRDTAIVASIAAACSTAGCALLGGETAEHPGVMEPDQVDLAATALGVVEKGAELGTHRVRSGDVVVGLRSPNLRSNGFSLVRAVVGDRDLNDVVDGRALIDWLLDPSVIYSPAVQKAVATGKVHAAAHITGGGLLANLARVIPGGLEARIDFDAWQPPLIFQLVAEWGDVSRGELRGVLNMGIGFCLITAPEDADAVIELCGHDALVIGKTVPV